METGRAEAFSDGVFAIAITLLILAVGVDQATAKGDLRHQLLHLWPAYIAYMVSFVTVGIMWVNHHAVFRHFSRVDRPLLLLNILLLMWFYATPIVYPISFVEKANASHPELFGHVIPVLSLYRLNPMVRLVGAYRNVLYDLRFPSTFDVAYVIAWGLVTLAFGLWTFRRLQGRVAEEL